MDTENCYPDLTRDIAMESMLETMKCRCQRRRGRWLMSVAVHGSDVRTGHLREDLG